MKNKTGVVIKLAVSCVLLCFFIALLIAGLAGFDLPFNFHFNIGSIYQYDNAEKYSIGDASFKPDSLDDIEINWVDGKVVLTPYDGDTVEIHEKTSGSIDEDDKLRYYYHDKKLIVQYRKSTKGFSFGTTDENKELEIKVPKNILTQLNDLTIDTTSADTTLSDIVTKNADYDTVSGNLTATNFNVSDELAIDAVSGDATINGSVNKVTTDTVSGITSINSSITPSSMGLDTVSGDITLSIPKASTFHVIYDSVSGDFTTDFSTTQRDEDYYCGDSSNDYEVDSVSGDLKILQNK